MVDGRQVDNSWQYVSSLLLLPPCLAENILGYVRELDDEWKETRMAILEKVVMDKTFEYQRKITDLRQDHAVSPERREVSILTFTGMASRMEHDWEQFQREDGLRRAHERIEENDRRRAENGRLRGRDRGRPGRGRSPDRGRSERRRGPLMDRSRSPTLKSEDADDGGADRPERLRSRYSVTPSATPSGSSTEWPGLKRTYATVQAGENGVLERNGFGQERVRIGELIIDLTD